MTMETPLEITFRNLDHSDAEEAKVREKVVKLEQVYGRITSCRVMIEAVTRQSAKGKLSHVTIDVGAPGRQGVVDRNSGRKDRAHQDVYVGLRDAFNAARRRLDDHSRKRAREGKKHEVPPHGKVVSL